MADSRIDWCDKVWEITAGCTLVSAGCTNCWAARYGNRFSGPGLRYDGLVKHGKWTGKVKLLPEKLEQPLHWRKPQRIFVNSKSDLFHKAVPDEFIAAVFGVMAACPQHSFLVLTKRPERKRRWFEWIGNTDDIFTMILSFACLHVGQELWDKTLVRAGLDLALPEFENWPLLNCWLGVSAENQAAADERIPKLLKIPAAVRYVSVEPQIGPIRLKRKWLGGGGAMESDGGQPSINWVICGAESGPKARPFDEAWAKSLRDQCVEAGVAYFYKQRPDPNGGGMVHTPKLDGRTWTQFPEVSK